MQAAQHSASDIVLFGAKGDLAIRKLIPSLFNLYYRKRIHLECRIFAVSRTLLSSKEYRNLIFKNANIVSLKEPAGREAWKRFTDRIHYIPLDASASDGYSALVERMNKSPAPQRRLFYLATDSGLYANICMALQVNKLINKHSYIVLEKPIGRDIQSAKVINEVVAQYFDEGHTFRIDHYLGKETVQNLFVLRFANPLFEFQWNYQFIDHIQITIAETVGVEERAGFYENVGAMRDMLQNHLLQLLCIIAMEPPINDKADSIRDEKLKVLRALRPIKPELFARQVIRGQYTESVNDRSRSVSYTQEKGVSPDSTVETFVAVKARIDNWRWAGVPFYLRTGKKLAQRCCEIVVQFKSIPHSMFESFNAATQPNKLIIRLQPEESIRLKICSKETGTGMNIKSTELNLSPSHTSDRVLPDGYERLLDDALNGKTTLFMRRDELEAAWQWVDPIVHYCTENHHVPEPYNAGSWGPPSSTLLLARDGRLWHEMS